jgi:arylsulfatase A-like enzyme
MIKLQLFLFLFSVSVFGQRASRPNILFIMADDHTSNAIGAYGGRLASLNPTPMIDQIAKEGALLKNTFCNNAICSPSRATIITGQYSATNGVTALGGKLLEKNQHLPIALRNVGYETAVIGKWHLGTLPLAFDYFNVLSSQGHYFNPIFTEKGMPTKVFKHGKKSEKGTAQIHGHSTDIITDCGLNWLKKRDTTKPFFLKLHFKAPHGPFDYAPRYEDYLSDVVIPEPDNYRDRKNNGSIATRGFNDELINRIGTSVGSRNIYRNSLPLLKDKGRGLSEETLVTESYQRYLKKYLRCVKGVDDNIKRVVSYLKENGLYDNTVIMYTGDQGFYLGEHDFVDKRWGYEEGMRMPFIVRYPKTVSAGLKVDAITENVDFAPTILDFANAQIPKVMQGSSFKSILEYGKEPENWKTAAYYHYYLQLEHHLVPAHIGIRTKEYKLLMFYGTDRKSNTPTTPPGWELYDLKNDPTEDFNVYKDLKYAEVVKDLKIKLRALRAKYKEDGKEFAFNQVIEKYWDYTKQDYERAKEISAKAPAYMDSLKQSKLAKNRKRKKGSAKELDDKHN